jgi:hypothetical protein
MHLLPKFHYVGTDAHSPVLHLRAEAADGHLHELLQGARGIGSNLQGSGKACISCSISTLHVGLASGVPLVRKAHYTLATGTHRRLHRCVERYPLLPHMVAEGGAELA